MEIKTQHENFIKHTQVSIAESIKQKKQKQTEDQLNEIKQEGEIIKKRVKRNEENLQEIRDYVKRQSTFDRCT